ncbi:MAG: FxDxF family PEP-CTERM protein [Pseudomonadota bacterium]
MKLNSMIAALALGVGLTGTAAAVDTQYGTYNLDVPGAPSYDLPYSFSTVKSFQNLTGTGVYFEDIWNLDFSTAAQVAGLVADRQIGSAYNISGFMVNLDGSGWVSVPGDLFDSVGTVSAGMHTLAVKGTADGTYGGAYLLSLTAVPVPEAETWAMILAGLGLVGLRVRKQMKSAERLVG